MLATRPARLGEGAGVLPPPAASSDPRRAYSATRPPAHASPKQTPDSASGDGRQRASATAPSPPPATADERPREVSRREKGRQSTTSPEERPTSASRDAPPNPPPPPPLAELEPAPAPGGGQLQWRSWHRTRSRSWSVSVESALAPRWSKKQSVSPTWYSIKPASLGASPMLCGPGRAGAHEIEVSPPNGEGRAAGSRSATSFQCPAPGTRNEGVSRAIYTRGTSD
mmetsp:Transcript_16037/g.51438  ORF Transcript_16037/g.51438 Transcript_16037/m.51438 type:complete len:226 (+) Transcript_16037:384-1061(+)